MARAHARRIHAPFALAATLLVGCGTSGTGRLDDHVRGTVRAERDRTGDVVGWAADGAVSRPELDLVAAGVDARGRRFRLHVVTEAPPRSALVEFTASESWRCADSQLAIVVRIDANGAVTARATDVPDARPRAVPGMTAELDGNDLTVDLPLEHPARVPNWYVFSSELGVRDPERVASDSIPDWYIAATSFVRGPGTPIYPQPCGPADPPLLPR